MCFAKNNQKHSDTVQIERDVQYWAFLPMVFADPTFMAKKEDMQTRSNP